LIHWHVALARDVSLTMEYGDLTRIKEIGMNEVIGKESSVGLYCGFKMVFLFYFGFLL
jgi:hypothetical protein